MFVETGLVAKRTKIVVYVSFGFPCPATSLLAEFNPISGEDGSRFLSAVKPEVDLILASDQCGISCGNSWVKYPTGDLHERVQFRNIPRLNSSKADKIFSAILWYIRVMTLRERTMHVSLNIKCVHL